MTHLLVIKDAAGIEIARVPVEKGWSLQEIADPTKAKGAKPPAPAPTASKHASDGGKGREKVN